MKKKLILILLFSIIALSVAFFAYYIYTDQIKNRQPSRQVFNPEEINIDRIKNDLEFAEIIPDYDIFFTGLVEKDVEISFKEIIEKIGDSAEIFNATGVRSDDEVIEEEFKGIRIVKILEYLDLQPMDEAKNIIVYASDLYAADFTISEMLEGDVYIAWKKDGQYFNPSSDGILKIVADNGPTTKWIKNPVLFDFISDFDDQVPLADRLEADAINFISQQRFFTLSLGYIPDIDIENWSLEITGLVEKSLELSYNDLLQIPQASVFATLETISNPQGGSLIGNAIWTGVPFKYLLEQTGIKQGAIEVVFYCEDGYSTSITIEEAAKEGVMLAYRMNGQKLTDEHGFPVRMVVPEKYGMKWPKWINKIEIVDYDYKGYWEQRGWSDYAGRDRPDKRFD